MKQKCQGIQRRTSLPGIPGSAKKVSLKPNRSLTFFNSGIECRLLEYELYEGTQEGEKDKVRRRSLTMSRRGFCLPKARLSFSTSRRSAWRSRVRCCSAPLTREETLAHREEGQALADLPGLQPLGRRRGVLPGAQVGPGAAGPYRSSWSALPAAMSPGSAGGRVRCRRGKPIDRREFLEMGLSLLAPDRARERTVVCRAIVACSGRDNVLRRHRGHQQQRNVHQLVAAL